MLGDRLVGLLVLVGLIYTIGVINRGWASPYDVILRVWDDMRYRRSEADDMSDVVSGDDVGSDVGSGVILQRPAGPRPMVDLIAEQPDEDDDPPPVTAAERREWVRARLRPDDSLHLTLTGIDRMGSELFDCSEKTIERDRMHVTRRRPGRKP